MRLYPLNMAPSHCLPSKLGGESLPCRWHWDCFFLLWFRRILGGGSLPGRTRTPLHSRLPAMNIAMPIPSRVETTNTSTFCRFCSEPLSRTFVDLGMSPLCETYPSADDIHRGEMFYPLHAYLCEKCFLVQLGEFESAENIFSEYAYFSSYSDSWLKHCETYCDRAVKEFGLGKDSLVVEVASNDGYLLQYFVRREVPVLGIEPAANVARVAVEKGVPTLVDFFGSKLAKELASAGKCADLIVGNNVLAQVPNLRDFVQGLKLLLKPQGVLTLEFPHLLRLIERKRVRYDLS